MYHQGTLCCFVYLKLYMYIVIYSHMLQGRIQGGGGGGGGGRTRRAPPPKIGKNKIFLA